MEAVLDDFEFQDFIGHGSFCQVERCVHKGTSQTHAAKRVVKSSHAVEQAVVMEGHCLRRLQSSEASQWVVRLFYEIHSPSEWIGILELCDCELWEKMKHCGCLSRDEEAWYAPQMVEALAAVHSAGIVHRDVKCENYLVTLEHRLKLIDFGTARDTAHPEVPTMMVGPQYEHHVGTPNFMSPEAIDGKVNDRKSDLWSLGCALYQLMLGVAPFNAATPFLILTKAQAGNIWLPSSSLEESLELTDLIKQLLRKDPEERLGSKSTHDILRHNALRLEPGCLDCVGFKEPLFECLRQLSRAMVAEVDAKVTADEAAAEAAQWEDAPGAVAQSLPCTGPKPGDAKQQLLTELNEYKDEQSMEIKKAVENAIAGEETTEFWTLDIAAAVEKSVLPMVPRIIQRFQEVAQQRLKDRQETLDFGGGTDEASEASVSSAVDAPDADNPGHDEAVAEVVEVVNHNQAGSAKDVKPTPCCDLM